MIQKMDGSQANVVGYKAIGKVTAEDYQQLEVELHALVDQYDDDIAVLIDLEEFAGEEVRAWLPDLKFGHHFHDKIDKMAIVGDKRWQKWIAALADPFYADDAKFFHTNDIDQAWAWLREDD